MAILNKIRKRSIVLIVVIALALFAFILADLFRNSDALSARSQNVVATVNGKDILRDNFMAQVETLQKQQQGRITNTQAMNTVYNREIEKAILEGQYESLGLTIEKDQMREALKKNLASIPDFQNEAGVFDENKLNEFIANLKAISPEFGYLGGQPINYQYWVNFEKQVANSYLKQIYTNLIKAGTVATLAEGETAYKLENEKVDIKYVRTPYSSIADSTITVSKSDINAYINAHKKDFEVEASRNINYVKFEEVASLEDENAIKNDLATLLKGGEVYNEVTKQTETVKGFAQVTENETFINANSDIKYNPNFVYRSALPKAFVDSIFNLKEGAVFGPYKDNGYYKVSKMIETGKLPDSVKARHILIPFKGSRSAKPESLTKEAAQKQSDSLLKVIKSNRSKFGELAKSFSADPGSGANGGDLGYFTNGRMVPEFNSFCFTGKKGDIGIVETTFGFHIIDIQDQKNLQKSVKIGTIARKIEPSETTNDKIFRDASNFELAVQKGDFTTIANEKNYSTRPVNGIKVLDENIPGLGSKRDIVRWAFEKNNTVGTVKRFNVPGGYAIIQLTAINEKGLMNVEDASLTVLPKIRKQKKAKLILDRINASTLEEFASAENTTPRTANAITMKSPVIAGAGREPLVVGTAFGLNERETSKLIVGETGVFMVQATKKIDATPLNNYQSFANQVARQKQAAVNSKLFSALKTTSDIEDNRANTVQ